ncbi:MAG: hypothetical protein Q9163_001427 [Psora crenata]
MSLSHFHATLGEILLHVIDFHIQGIQSEEGRANGDVVVTRNWGLLRTKVRAYIEDAGGLRAGVLAKVGEVGRIAGESRRVPHGNLQRGIFRVATLRVLANPEVATLCACGVEVVIGGVLRVALVRLGGYAGWVGVGGCPVGKEMDLDNDVGSEPDGSLTSKLEGATTRGLGMAATTAHR